LRPSRWPTLQSLGLRLLDRAKVFLHRAGTIILLVTVILWVMAHVPYAGGKEPIEHSLAGTMGRTIEPLIKPLGFNWKIGIGLITSLATRETIISTLGTIYGPDSHGLDLQKALRQDLTSGGAVALLIFFAFAMQCMSTVAVVRPRNRRMDVAHPAIRLHGRARLRGRLHRLPRDRLKPDRGVMMRLWRDLLERRYGCCVTIDLESRK
jgi:Fe2+ transport system protein B